MKMNKKSLRNDLESLVQKLESQPGIKILFNTPLSMLQISLVVLVVLYTIFLC